MIENKKVKSTRTPLRRPAARQNYKQLMDILQWWPLPDSDICFLLFAYRVGMVVVLAEEAATGPATTNNLLAVDNFLRIPTNTSLQLTVY